MSNNWIIQFNVSNRRDCCINEYKLQKWIMRILEVTMI